MPKRTPGGRVKRSQAPKDRRRPAPAAERAPAEREPLTARERAEATHPARAPAATSAAPARQSLLASVRRPGRQTGPTLVTDYAYVMADLRRIGILAAAAFAILVVLTFVIR